MQRTNNNARRSWKHNNRIRKIVPAAIATISAAVTTGNVLAASGTWTFNTAVAWNASWSTVSNWAGGIVADGAGNLADFSTLNITVNPTVNLDTPRTIGRLSFSDTTQSNLWTLDNNGNAANVLTLDNGASQPIITVNPNNNTFGTLNTTISASLAGTNGFIKTGGGALVLSGSNSVSGQILVTSTSNNNGADLYIANNNALGSATLFIDPTTSFKARVLLNSGITINNNIIINNSNSAAGANGAIMTNGNVSATINGNITINAANTSGGHIVGAFELVGTDSFSQFLRINGAITLSSTYKSVSGNQDNAAGKGLLLRGGNYILAGGGDYYRAELRAGIIRLGATNGIATNAYLDLAGNAAGTTGNGNPVQMGVLDLNGFNQTLVGIQDLINNNFNAIVTNGINAGMGRSTAGDAAASGPATLTLAPADPNVLLQAGDATSSQGNLVFTATTAGNGNLAFITDNPASPLSLVINGAPNGNQTLNTPASNYHGSTTLISGILSVNALANGGANSSIGASSSDATNLVFSGGTLRYTGASTSTDRNFTMTTSTSSTIDVSAGATLTMNGGGTGGGGLIKAGAGTLQFSANQTYTGNTTISAGTLRVDGNLAAASNVTIASSATLAGTGTLNGTVSAASGGIIAPAGAGSVGSISTGALTLNTGSQINFEFSGGNDMINVANANGLALNGGNLSLYQSGTTSPFSTNGTYTLFNENGFTGTTDNLTVSNPVAGKFYNITGSGSAISLTIGDASTIQWTNATNDNSWTTAGNWNGVIPNAVGQTASFGSLATGSGSVNLNGNKTVSGVIFDSSATGISFDLFGSGNLTLDNGSAAGAVTIANGSHTIDVPLVIAGNVAIQTSNGGDSLTMNGNISGAFPITDVGPGALTLTGSNSFTNLSISGGTVNVGNGGANGSLGTGPVTLANGAVLRFNTSRIYNYGQSITGAGTLQHDGSGTTTVGAVNVSGLNVTNGLLITGSIAQAGGINVTGGGLTANGPISGAGKLLVNTSGAVSLGASNTYTGGTEIDAGTVTLNGVNSIPPNSALAVNGGTLNLNTRSIAINNIQDSTGSSGVITNNGAAGTTSTISFSGNAANYDSYAAITDGTNGGKVALNSFIENTASSQNGTDNQYRLALHHSNAYTGGTTVNKQSIEADASNAFGTGSIQLVQNNTSTNNTRIYLAGGITLPNDIVIAQPNPYSNANTSFGVLQYLAGSTGNVTLTGAITQQANAFSGTTFQGPATTSTDVLNVNGPVTATGTANTISAAGNVGFGGGGSYPNLVLTGKAIVNAPNGIATNAAVNMTSATLELNGNNQALTGLTGSGLASNSGSTATLTLNAATSGTFSGVIGGNLHLVKNGAGVQTLAGVNTYTGSTIINGGTLKLPSPVTSPVGAYSFDDIRDTGGNPVTSGTPGQGYVVTNDGSGGAGMNGSVNHSDNIVDNVNGTATITQGRFGNGLHLDGLGDSVDIASQIVNQAGGGSWSLSAWVKTSTPGSSYVSKNAGATTWNTGHSVFYLASNPIGSAGSLPTGVRNGGGFVQGDPSPASVTDNNWHLLTFVDNAGTKLVYVDGVPATMTMTAFTTADTSTFVRLGYDTDTVAGDGAVHFSGDLDEIKFFGIALTNAQVLGLFNNNLVPGGGSQYLPAATPVSLAASGATLDLSDNNQVIGSLTGVSGSIVDLGTGVLTTGGDNTSTTFAGAIIGNGGIVKTGTGTFTMTGANTYSGGTSVNAGALVAAKLSNGTISVSGGLAKLTAKGTGNNVSGTTVAPALTITGGSVDITNNAMVLTTANTSPATLRGYLQSGALTSSTTAGGFAIGYADNSLLGRTTFGGVPVDATKLLVGFVYNGDSNLDGKVNLLDFNAVATNFGGSGKFWTSGDFTYDGTVNTFDFNALAQNFIRTEPTPALGLGALVPEPASTGAILMAGGIAMLHRRRRAMK